MRTVFAVSLILLSSVATANAGSHELFATWARHFGIHNGAGYHAPKPVRGGPACLPVEAGWHEPVNAEPVLPVPQLAPPHQPDADATALPQAQPAFRLEREAHRGPHFFTSPTRLPGTK